MVSINFNLKLGASKDANEIKAEDLKAGVKKTNLDAKYESIFNALDEDGNNILTDNEINKLKSCMEEAAKIDGDATSLSKNEARKLLQKLNVSGLKVQDLFEFINSLKNVSQNIDYCIGDADTGDLVIAYKEQNGEKNVESHDMNTGELKSTKTIIDDAKEGKIEYIKDKNGTITGGKNYIGEFTRIYNEDGSYSDQYPDRTRNYDKNGKWIGGKLADGVTYESKYNEDGSCTRTYSDGEIEYYDKNGKKTGGQLANGNTYTREYNQDGSRAYDEYTRKDGSKYYWGDNHTYAEKTARGNVRGYAKNGETFDDTMKRLGITDPADQAAFRAANPKAYARGYFIVGMLDVYIPKKIADKLDMRNIMINKDDEVKKYKESKKAQFGV